MKNKLITLLCILGLLFYLKEIENRLRIMVINSWTTIISHDIVYPENNPGLLDLMP